MNSPSAEKKTYPSAVDTWLAVVLIGTPLAIIGLAALFFSQSLAGGIITIHLGLLTGAVIAFFSVPCIYTLTDESLTIKCGLREEVIPLRQIQGAEKSSSARSAPALSLKRVKISLAGGHRLISPKNRDGFMSDLAARLERAGSPAQAGPG